MSKDSKKIQKGDFVLFDYEGRMDDQSNILIDTTKEEVAKEAKMYNKSYKYCPELAIVGQAGYVLPGLDEALVGMDEKETKEKLIIPPSKGFGTWDPNKIEKKAIRALKIPKRNIKKGAWISVRDKYGSEKKGRIRKVDAGFVEVDTNHFLAGKNLSYSLTVTKIIRDDNEKTQALVGKILPGIDETKYTISSSKKDASIEIDFSAEMLFVQGIHFIAFRLGSTIREVIGYQKVKISFTFKQPEKTEEKNGTKSEDKKEPDEEVETTD